MEKRAETKAAAVMADWLALHGVAARDVLDLLPDAVDDPRAARTGKQRLSMPAPAVWALAGTAFGAGSGDDRLRDQVLTRTLTEFAPDRTRFPRAFTVHDAGEGRPLVCCPFQGRIRDALTLAHEFGHAAQILASGPRAMPPVLRETCAFAAEGWLLDHLQRHDPDLWTRAKHVWQTQTRLYCGRDGETLRAALADPDSRYDYNWNYPVARRLALLAAQAVGFDYAALFQGRLTLTDVAAAMGQ